VGKTPGKINEHKQKKSEKKSYGFFWLVLYPE
jgi:hypothetical protein